MSTNNSDSNTSYNYSIEGNNAYPDGIHALDPSNSIQSFPRSIGKNDTLVGVAYRAAKRVDLAKAGAKPEVAWAPWPGGGGGSGVEDDIR